MYSASQVLGSLKHAGNYGANFILGTSSTTMGNTIGNAIKNRKANNMGLIKSIRTGFADGFVKSNQEVKAAGGFFSNLGKTFGELPANMAAGWKSGAGKNGFTKFFSSLGKSIKPLGKLMPFAMNALWLLQSVPDIVSRTKDEGIWGGLKETGKTLVNMGVIALAASVGASFGFIGMIALPMVAGSLCNMVMGKPYGVKKAEEKEAQKQAALAQQNNPFQQGKNLDIKL